MRPDSVAAGDQPVQATNDDAQVSKLSCVQRGYFEDRFVQFFVKRGSRRAPLINRGYYTRHAALQQLIQEFLGLSCEHTGQKQILSLGAGFDTTWFRLQEQGMAPVCYYELDFAQVTRRKAQIIASQAALHQLIDNTGSANWDSGAGCIKSGHYCLLPGDLRDTTSIQQTLAQAGFRWELPTLVLAECVLVYMAPEHSSQLLRCLGGLLPTAACIVYEQICPDDAFGQQMLRNLESRGCPLRGLHATPSLEAHELRFTNNGWTRASAVDLDAVYRHHIDPADKARIERLEIFDEFEEWHLIQEHYCIAIGINDAQGVLANYKFKQYPAPSISIYPRGVNAD